MDHLQHAETRSVCIHRALTNQHPANWLLLRACLTVSAQLLLLLLLFELQLIVLLVSLPGTWKLFLPRFLLLRTTGSCLLKFQVHVFLGSV